MIKQTIYQVLKTKLGREPSHAELVADCKRILAEGLQERAAQGRLQQQQQQQRKR